MRVSIIVPVLNEALGLEPFLRHLRQRAPEAEIVVADGGSRDNTPDLASRLSDQVVLSEHGRAVQMNAGATASRGDLLWFLHADTEVPWRCLDEIGRIMVDPSVAGGFFRIRLPPHPAIYRLTDSFAHHAGILLRMRCGDHGIFCRRSVFAEIGGFPEVPLMEDIEFFRRLHRCGRVVHSNERIVVSPRRYQAIGPARLTFAYGLIATLYLFGAPLSLLARIYQRACCVGNEPIGAS